MKKVFALVVLLSFFVAAVAVAEDQPAAPQPSIAAPSSSDSQIDERFKKANEYLSQQHLAITQSTSDAFVNGYILVAAEGLPKADAISPGQKRLTAERAAEVLAYRKLAEFLDGVAVVGDSLVKDAALQYDLVRAAVAGFVKGARVVHKEYNKEDETALVIMKIGMTGPGSFADALYAKILKPDVKKELIEQPQQQPPAPQYKHKPVPLEEKYDGLVIDATEQNFRPALINRLFSQKGEVLYDPSKISQKVLVEQGCGEYTNSVDKAKAALDQRGAKNPLIVKASGSVNPSDLQISDDDAVKIFSANQKAGFFAAAKVAFVLK
ncbi:MAG: hypothetical protein EPN94_02645 [Nitrospirae bacterium]|nr:MAG: hypothetical protein EPN94_02645 [Nitrospirota bacterium]